MTSKININNELELENWLTEILTKNGWIVKRQIIADSTKNWTTPYRIDIITWHPFHHYLNPIGIELKYCRNQLGGKIFAEAFDQLCKYSFETFEQQKLNSVILGVYSECENNPYADQNMIRFQKTTMQAFFNHFGIGFIDLNKWNLSVKFAGAFSAGNVQIHNQYTTETEIDKSEEKYLRQRIFKTEIFRKRAKEFIKKQLLNNQIVTTEILNNLAKEYEKEENEHGFSTTIN